MELVKYIIHQVRRTKNIDNDSRYMKIIYVHCSEETKIRDPCSYKHYWTGSWNKIWKKFRPVWDLNPWPLRCWQPISLSMFIAVGFQPKNCILYEGRQSLCWSQVAHPAKAYPGFHSMKQLRVIQIPLG